MTYNFIKAPSKLCHGAMFFVRGFCSLLYFYVENLMSDAEKYLY